MQHHPNSNLVTCLSLQMDVANTSRTVVSSREVPTGSGGRAAFLHLPNPSIHFTISSFKVLKDWGPHALPRLVLQWTLSLRSKYQSRRICTWVKAQQDEQAFRCESINEDFFGHTPCSLFRYNTQPVLPDHCSSQGFMKVPLFHLLLSSKHPRKKSESPSCSPPPSLFTSFY